MIGPFRRNILGLALLAGFLLTACLGQGTRITSMATAKEITAASELIGGPNATGRLGDFLMANERIRVVIQKAGRAGPTPFSLGGSLIDVDRVRFPGDVGADRFGGMALLLNGVRTARADRVFVLEDGTATGQAIIRAEGDDAPYQGFTLRQFAESVSQPAKAFERGVSLELLVKTDYILRPGANFIEVRTTFLNRKSSASFVMIGDAVDYGSTTPFFSGGKGFVLPDSRHDFGAAAQTVVFEAREVSYGYSLGRQTVIQAADKRSRAPWIDTAVWVPFDGLLHAFYHYDHFQAAAEPEPADKANLLEVPGAGSASFTRFLIVGSGDSGEIFEALNTVENRDSEYVSGEVLTQDADGAAVAAVGADVAVLAGGHALAHFRTDANGQYGGALPPGSYELAVNMKGHPYPDGVNEPDLEALTIGKKDGKVHAVDFIVPASGRLRLFVKDMSSSAITAPVDPVETPLAARVRIARLAPDPSPGETTTSAGVIRPFRPAESDVVTVDASGEYSLDLEPGDYEITAFHGPAFSLAKASATLKQGARTDRVLELAQVVHSATTLSADFSAQTHRGRGALSPEDRILEGLADGLELIVLADVGTRLDAEEALLALDQKFGTGEAPTPISKQIAVSSGERVRTSGYGSFAAWPVYADDAADGGHLAWDGGLAAALTPGELITQLIALGTSPAPLVSIDMPYARPGSLQLGYFDAVDPRVDWATGDILVGENAVNTELAGIDGANPEALWTDQWAAINLFSSPDTATAWLGINTWFAFLNLQLRPNTETGSNVPQITALGSAVDAGGAVAGTPRNHVRSSIDNVFVFRSTDDDNTANREAMSVLNTFLGARQNIVSNGPFIDLAVMKPDGSSRTPVGGTFSLFPATEARFEVSVTTPCWITVDRIDIFKNAPITEPTIVNNRLVVAPQPVSTFTAAAFTATTTVFEGRTGVVAPRSQVCRPDGSGFGSIEIKLTDTLDMPRDAWIVAVASGTTAMDGAATPLAFTNAIFVDVNGNSEIDVLCPGADCPNSGKTRLGWWNPDRNRSFLP